ncbi:Tetratricopeptide-like helical [Corchorus olitorius]|uniref:Tetratricopeptide-like helical n=1 Tax=Corchorus olitorius TaxID=93759 RepID=A0A1R3H468_9ROSI|nr:Tetratricopeptide-like helical [Corchorus olitorius]
METLILKSATKFKILNSRFPPSIYPFHFRSSSREDIRFLQFSNRKCFHQIPRNLNFSPTKASLSDESRIYGGWDDFEPGSWSAHSDESTQLRDFLVSAGVYDKKHVFVFLTGLVCALAICKVRVSTIVVFPASVLVFGIGFSFGFVKGGSFNELSSSKRRSKEETLRVYSDKFRNLADFFDGFDVKVNNLKNDIQKAIDSNRISVGDLENYVCLAESMRLSASDARIVVEASMDNVKNSYKENQKTSGRKKEDGEVGFELFQFIGSLFGEKSLASKPNQIKDDVKSESVDTSSNSQTRGNVSLPDVGNASLPDVEDRVSTSLNNGSGVPNQGFAQDSLNKSALNQDRDRRIDIDSENGKIRSDFLGGRAKRFIDSEEFNYKSNRMQYTRDISFETSSGNESKRWKSDDNMLDSVDFSVRLKHSETEASFIREQLFQESSRSYQSSYNGEKRENEAYGKRRYYEDEPHLADHQSARECDYEVSSSSSSKFSDDLAFDRYLTEASGLLKEAKEYMRGRHYEEQVEIILKRSATLLSQAITMKPMSLLAVGQLGNTYLLHGELKLHVSRELRSLLARNDPVIDERPKARVLKGIDDYSRRDKIVSLLVNACEECEELLVGAGRKYRLALSIDGDDVRSLYNWGLALSFRAQLIADIGPEAVFDADKLFLAAIDKFDAMLSRGNIHAPDALFRWGVTLQQRSRLRPSNSKEKVKLLQQAKRLYEDALHMDSKNMQVRDALSSCVSELNYRYFQ